MIHYFVNPLCILVLVGGVVDVDVLLFVFLSGFVMLVCSCFVYHFLFTKMTKSIIVVLLLSALSSFVFGDKALRNRPNIEIVSNDIE